MRTAAKCIAMAPFVPDDPHADIKYGDNLDLIVDSGTTWVRLWADWPTCWPTEGAINEYYMLALGLQIDAALARGLKVMLTAYRYPRWANHCTIEDDWRASLRVPDALGRNSQYGRWIRLLMQRYGSRIARLEVCNEPNAMNWPQSGMPERVATMFKTATAITTQLPHRVRLGGPALADWGYKPERAVTFASAVLIHLSRIGASIDDALWTWTHHNYQDIQRRRWGDTNSTQAIRRLLEQSGIWHDEPFIALTEGGVKCNGNEVEQRDTLGLAMQQLHRNNGPGENIAMITNYLLRTDPGYDTGLLDMNGRKRLAYGRWGL